MIPPSSVHVIVVLRQHLCDEARADRAVALADGEAGLLLQRDGLMQLHGEGGVVARHHHVDPAAQLNEARHIGRAEVELRAVVPEERRMPSALVLRQHIDLSLIHI